jgi:hypothetical protein
MGTLSTSEGSGALYLSVPIFSYATLYSIWGDAGILSVGGFCLILFALVKKRKGPDRPKKSLPSYAK